MPVKSEYRDREQVEIAVLDALVDRGDEGMTVLELRSFVDADIDTIEAALTTLKDDDLIVVEESDGNQVIKPADEVVPSPSENREQSIVDRVRERLPF